MRADHHVVYGGRLRALVTVDVSTDIVASTLLSSADSANGVAVAAVAVTAARTPKTLRRSSGLSAAALSASRLGFTFFSKPSVPTAVGMEARALKIVDLLRGENVMQTESLMFAINTTRGVAPPPTFAPASPCPWY